MIVMRQEKEEWQVHQNADKRKRDGGVLTNDACLCSSNGLMVGDAMLGNSRGAESNRASTRGHHALHCGLQDVEAAVQVDLHHLRGTGGSTEHESLTQRKRVDRFTLQEGSANKLDRTPPSPHCRPALATASSS
eukprot:scaffold42308_cov19-Tisochrysis_lutea.AAC.1